MTGEMIGAYMMWWDEMVKEKLMEYGVSVKLY